MLIRVKPGLMIRDPVTKAPIPPEGITVADDDLFYARRIREGSVEIVRPDVVSTIESMKRR